MRYGLLKGTNNYKIKLCEHCVVGKKTRVKFSTANHNTREILEYVHNNVWGPTKTTSISESHYFISHLLMISLDVCGCTPCEQMTRF